MTVKIKSDYNFSTAQPLKFARVMHKGVSQPFTTDAASTTNVASAIYSESAPETPTTFDRYKPNSASWTYKWDLDGGAANVNCVCLLGSGLAGVTLTLQYINTIWTTIDVLALTDDSPAMFLFAPVNGSAFRVTATGGAPEIFNVMCGSVLEFERGFYAGHAPTRMNRSTEVIGNYSGSGELLGRTKKRTTLSGQYAWENLRYDWVRTNLDGPSGLIQSLETWPCYVAWRPGLTQDVDFVMRAQTEAPSAQGIRDLFNFNMSGEVYSYE